MVTGIRDLPQHKTHIERKRKDDEKAEYYFFQIHAAKNRKERGKAPESRKCPAAAVASFVLITPDALQFSDFEKPSGNSLAEAQRTQRLKGDFVWIHSVSRSEPQQ